MKNLVDFVQYFDPKISDPQPADPETSQVADDIEYKLELKRAASGSPQGSTQIVTTVRRSASGNARHM